MAPKKKLYATRSDRQRAYEARLQEAGRRRVCFWIDETTIEKLGRLATSKETDKGSVIEELTARAKEPK